MMKNFLISVYIVVFFTSCGDIRQRVEQKSGGQGCACMPKINLEIQNDTVSVGEEYIAKVSLSDMSFLNINRDGIKETFLPIFKINGEVVESNESYYVYRKKVTPDDVDSLEEPILKEWTSGIIFPHPEWGDVEISQRNSYVVVKE